MALVVNTNVASLNAQRSLAASGLELKTAMERLSSYPKTNAPWPFLILSLKRLVIVVHSKMRRLC